MQVAHVQDHVTHAVIGANTAKSYGISQSAAFFNILSNTLYSDKHLAVVREVLCNGWDAHIASGRTDTPIQITLNGEILAIRDFGTGLSKETIVPIYCVYGESTKLNDGEQTGGFGLGSKAPWAYAEHFEVTSHHAGQKTIYRASKSSGSTDGLPSFMPIISLPSDETGIQVQIEIKNQADIAKFKEAIVRIVLAGEMNVELNGAKLQTLPFSEAKEGYLITNQQVAGQGSNHRIFVRYGNVVYPIEAQEAYKSNYLDAAHVLSQMATRHGYGNHNNFRLILQAKPHSISVTPSRESLSMTDHTIESVGKLLADFIGIRDKRLDIETQKVNEGCIEQTFWDLKPAKVLETHLRIVGLQSVEDKECALTDFAQVSRAIASSYYPKSSSFRKMDVELRLRSLIASGFGNRGKIQTFLAEYLDKKRKPDAGSDWLHRRLVGPLIVAMKANKELSPVRLMIYGKDESITDRQRRYSFAENTFTEAHKFSKYSLESYLPFLRNVVILTHNRVDVEERSPHFPAMKHWLGSPADSLVYLVQRSEPKLQAARAFFQKEGFTVIDLTTRYKGEPLPVAPDRKPRDYKVRAKGIPALSNILGADGKISTDLAKSDEAVRIENPEFYVKNAARNDARFFEDWNAQASIDIAHLFGAKGGIVVNDTQAAKYAALGAKPALAWIFDKVVAELKTNTRIHSYLSVDKSRLKDGPSRLDYGQRETLEVIVEDDVLRTYYDIGHTMTEDDARYLRLWRELAQKLRWVREKDVLEVTKYLNTFPLSDSMKTVSAAIKSSELVDMINLSALGRLLGKSENSPTINMQKARARDLLIYAVAG